jgi:hypothetical protein
MGAYKHGNGRLVQRSGNGRFRKTTPEDLGIMDANKEGIVFICNVCEREFVPLVLSGKCCGVDDKRRKVIVVTPEEQAIMDKINALRQRPFINRQILNEINELEVQLYRVRHKPQTDDRLKSDL